MPSTLKQIDVEGVQKAERFRVEIWVQDGYDGVEAEAHVYPCLTRPAAGALPAQECQCPTKVTLAAATKTALWNEIKAAVDAELAK